MVDSLLLVTQCAPYVDGPSGVHRVLDQAQRAYAQLAAAHGLRFRFTDDVRQLDDDAFYRARVLVLFTIGETPWSQVQQAEIRARVRAGALGVISVHSATDSSYSWDYYGTLVGARFDGHPWTQWFTAEVSDAAHPAVAHLGAAWHWHDEVYQFRDLRDDATVLLRVPVDQLDVTAPGARPPAFGYPLAWCHHEGRGRVFSTALGHFPEAWESNTFLRHLDGGLAWVLASE